MSKEVRYTFIAALSESRPVYDRGEPLPSFELSVRAADFESALEKVSDLVPEGDWVFNLKTVYEGTFDLDE